MENRRPELVQLLSLLRQEWPRKRSSRFSVKSTNVGLFIFRILRHPSSSLVLRTGSCILLVLSLSSASVSAPVQNTALQQKAREAFVRAQEMERTLNDKSPEQRTRSEYIKVIDAYQRVYVITPHTAYADNALVTMARL